MAIAVTPLVVLLVVAGVLATAVAYAIWQYRPKAGASWLSIGTAGVAIAGFAGAALFATDDSGQSLFVGLAAAGPIVSSTSFVLFSARYTGRDSWMTTARVALLWTVAGAIIAVTVLNPDELMFRVSGLDQTGRIQRGPGMIAYLTFGYSTQGLSIWLLIRKLRRSRNVYRRRTFLFVLIGVVMLGGHMLSVAGVSPLPHITIVPVSFLGIGVLAALVLYNDAYLRLLPVEGLFSLARSRFEGLGPIARDVVIEEMGSGVVILDEDNQIVDVNPMARRILGDGERIIGVSLWEVIDRQIFEDEPDFLQGDLQTGRFDGIWVSTPNGRRRCYDVVLTDLGKKRSDVTGKVAIIHDVTEQRQDKQRLQAQTRKLKRQNENLEEFANIVSHDLRNPLTVAIGQVEYAIETGSVENLDSARQAHDRIESIISDVLRLARQGKSVDETEAVDLSVLAADARDSIDHPDVTFEDHFTGQTVDADRSRLQQVFENLFRNAVEHGGGTAVDTASAEATDGGDTSITVSVGPMDDGFYVEDDGPGIPENERESVLVQGYTTSDGGTGLGLAIVSTIVDAHGWDIAVTESDSGGARFEIRTE